MSVSVTRTSSKFQIKAKTISGAAANSSARPHSQKPVSGEQAEVTICEGAIKLKNDVDVAINIDHQLHVATI